jgi:hypothetical protein
VLTRFYSFSENDYNYMSWTQFTGYLEHIPEIRRIEEGKPLSLSESMRRAMALADKAERKR